MSSAFGLAPAVSSASSMMFRLHPCQSCSASGWSIAAGLVSDEIGGFVHLEGVPYEIVGTMGRDFWFPDAATDAWLPLLTMPVPGSTWRATALARPLPGLTLSDAEARAQRALESAGQTGGVSLHRYDRLRTGGIRQVLGPIQMGALLALVLVIVNATWLMLADTQRGGHAYRVRAALGATPRHLTCAVLAGLLPSAVAAVPLATLLSSWLVALARTTLSSQLPGLQSNVAVGELVLQASLISTIMGLLAATPSILYAVRLRPSEALGTHRMVAPIEGFATGGILLVQTGVVLALAAQAFWLSTFIRAAIEANVGLGSPEWHWARVDLSQVSPDDSTLDRLGAVVFGLESGGVLAAVATTLPLGDGWIRTSIRRIDQEDRSKYLMARVTAVTPRYFEIIGLSPERGRVLRADDRGHRLLVVNRTFAAFVFPGQDAVDQVIEFGDHVEWRIAGVVPTVGQLALTDREQPEAYLLFDDLRFHSAEWSAYLLRRPFLLVDPRHARAQASQQLQAAVHALLPSADVGPLRPFRELVAQAAGPAPVIASAASWLAVATVLLLSVGTFAVWDQRAVARRRDMAIRQALGASPEELLWRHLLRSGVSVALSAPLGCVVFWWLQRLARPTLEISSRVSTPSPELAFALAAASIWVVALLASWRPARQLRDVNIVEALRSE
jgi:putative ABC transport system permease protein